jgi:flagellar L-ring protein FlgH
MSHSSACTNDRHPEVRCRDSGRASKDASGRPSPLEARAQRTLAPRIEAGAGSQGDGGLASLLRIAALVALVALLGGCAAVDRLWNIGEQPKLSAIENPTAQAGYKPVQMPMPAPQSAVYNPNSLWRNGSRAFFNDQRAHQIGDILTVKVKITDKAKYENETSRSRTNKEDSGVTDFIGSKTIGNINKAVLPGRILTADSTATSEGKGSIDRKEELSTNIAAVVTQVLPNGNLVVEGKQEVRVNYEVRELIVAGVVRPEDIESDNTIDSTKIAQARIAYGGRGQITDVQQPRYGQQVLDVLLPF